MWGRSSAGRRSMGKWPVDREGGAESAMAIDWGKDA